MSVAPKLPILNEFNTKDTQATLDKSLSHDLVIAIVGHIGAGATRVASSLREAPQLDVYNKHEIKMSKIIEDSYQTNNHNDTKTPHKTKLDRTQYLQDAGNWLRRNRGKFSTAALAAKAIHAKRQSADPEKHNVFIIDSLKNPNEVDALRRVYGSSFYLISVVCNPDIRDDRLPNKYIDSNTESINKIKQRDEAENDIAGQDVRKTSQLADFFVCNDEDNADTTSSLSDALSRFVEVITGTKIIRPTQDERGMYAAWSAGLRSSCLSRQVGAAIVNSGGDVISTGTNDVPRFGGGLYEESSGTAVKPDHRCFVDGEYCRSDATKSEIFDGIFNQLKKDGHVNEKSKKEDIISSIKHTQVSDIVEFSRAVHAEMDAIVAIARTGNGTTTGNILYCTTYPCHNCARHIVASGIKEVVYYEPYTKSRALRLHEDSITESKKSVQDKVLFRLFEGVAPRRFSSLFEKRKPLKDKNGKLAPSQSGTHVDPNLNQSYIVLEEKLSSMI